MSLCVVCSIRIKKKEEIFPRASYKIDRIKRSKRRDWVDTGVFKNLQRDDVVGHRLIRDIIFQARF